MRFFFLQVHLLFILAGRQRGNTAGGGGGGLALVEGYVHEVSINNDDRPVFFITSFGFGENGMLSITIDRFMVDGADYNGTVDGAPPEFGFLVRVSLTDQSQLADQLVGCPLKIPPTYNEVSYIITRRTRWNLPTHHGLYNLYFINCIRKPVSFQIEISEWNTINGRRISYLPVGLFNIMWMFVVFSGLYFVAAFSWFCAIRRTEKQYIKRVHHVMTAVLLFKILSLASRAVELHYLNIFGQAHGWNLPYYIFTLIKGVLMFIGVALLGMGYTFFKHHLNDRESKILLVVLPLQVLSNVANIMSIEGNWGSVAWKTWTSIFQVVDVVCCIAVVVPIALSIKHLREAAATDGKAALSMQKLQLFRHFYLIVLSYLYFTRIIVVCASLLVPYYFEWINPLFEELAALAFYVIIGYKFRPNANSFFHVDQTKNEELSNMDKASR